MLIAPVSKYEIDKALYSIIDLKDPGLDGSNACFIRTGWDVLKDDVYSAVLEFFYTSKLHLPVNCTSVTLVTKVSKPSHIKEYRPIACCSLI